MVPFLFVGERTDCPFRCAPGQAIHAQHRAISRICMLRVLPSDFQVKTVRWTVRGGKRRQGGQSPSRKHALCPY